MPKMIAMTIPEAGGRFQRVERDLPEPGRHEVRLRVLACGVCHSDVLTVQGLFPGIAYPRTRGHEVIDAIGPDVDGWTLGERAGVGWFSGACECGNSFAGATRKSWHDRWARRTISTATTATPPRP
jgi:D-arabinose 1-dehydrogenase-like Zn-dependent alcohol dehydrogenase